MDKDFKDAIVNFAQSAELMVKHLSDYVKNEEDKTKGIYSAITGENGMVKIVERIQNDVTEIKKDVKKIIQNHDQLIGAARQQDSKNPLSQITEENNSDKIKSGANILIFMAAGIVAIGAAFSIIPDVNPITVISLAFAIKIMGDTMVNMQEKGVPDYSETSKMIASVIAFTGGVVASGFLLRAIPEITTSNLINFGILTAAFAVASYSIPKLTRSVRGLDFMDVLRMVAILPAFTTGIVLSSYIMNAYSNVDEDKLGNFIMFGGSMALVTLAMALPMAIIGKMSGSILKGAAVSVVAMPLLATAMALTAGVFTFADSEGVKYDNYPSIGWSLSVTASMLSFTLGAAVVGGIMATGVGALILGAGALGVIGLAGVITKTSHVLSEGDYSYGRQMIPWSSAIGISFLSFVPAFLAIGTISAIPFAGGKIMEKGEESILMIATTIQKTSDILAKGTYNNSITPIWAMGTALSMGAFVPAFIALGAINAIPFTGNIIESGKNAILDIATTIVEVSDILTKNTSWGGHPTKEWAEGVGLAIGAFAPVYSNLNSSIGGILDSIFGRDTSEKMNSAMVTMAGAIIEVDKELTGHKFSKNSIDPKWAESVGVLIYNFSKSYSTLKQRKITQSDIDSYTPVLLKIAETISNVSNIIKGAEIKSLVEIQNIDMVKASDGFEAMATSISKLNRSLRGFDDGKVKALKSSMTALATMSLLDYDNMDKMAKLASEKEEELTKLIGIMSSGEKQKQEGIFASIKKIFGGGDTQAEQKQEEIIERKKEVNTEILEGLQRIETYLASIATSSKESIKKLSNLKKEDTKIEF